MNVSIQSTQNFNSQQRLFKEIRSLASADFVSNQISELGKFLRWHLENWWMLLHDVSPFVVFLLL